ncbi:uncharacterized protein LOC135494157 [Lineus longissimus]|uniref:uncharacterized protein LOC135494157 n=1 Tax=Lineus longissimus TaxID=88925 RepID=UPI002B4F5FE0
MKVAILMVALVVLQGTDAFLRSRGGRITSSSPSAGSSPTRTGSSTGGTSTNSGPSTGRRPVLPGPSTGGSTRPKLPGSLPSGTTGTRNGQTTATKKLMGDDVKTRLPTDEPKLPTETTPRRPDIPGAEKSKLNQALETMKQYKDVIIEGVLSAAAESAAALAFDAIVGSWQSSNEEGAAVQETPSGETVPAELTNECTDEEGAEIIMVATRELLDAGLDPESAEGKQYIQDILAFDCAQNTARR